MFLGSHIPIFVVTKIESITPSTSKDMKLHEAVQKWIKAGDGELIFLNDSVLNINLFFTSESPTRQG